MKPVVWVILAILVVAAIIFMVVARRGSTGAYERKWDAEEFAKFADKMDNNIARYEEKMSKLADQGISPQAQPMVDQFNTKIEEMKAAVNDLRADNSDEKAEKIKELYKDLRKTYRDLGGAAEEEDIEE